MIALFAKRRDAAGKAIASRACTHLRDSVARGCADTGSSSHAAQRGTPHPSAASPPARCGSRSYPAHSRPSARRRLAGCRRDAKRLAPRGGRGEGREGRREAAAAGATSEQPPPPPQQPAARGAALEGNALTAMCCTLGLASLLFLCDFSGPFPFSGCFAVIPPALRPRFSPPSLKPLPSLLPSFPCSHSCRRTALPVPTKAEIAAKPSALQRLSAGGAAPVSPPSIAPTKTTQHRTHPPHPASSSRRAARPEGLPRRLDPHLAFPPVQHTHAAGQCRLAARCCHLASRTAVPAGSAPGQSCGWREGVRKLRQRAQLRPRATVRPGSPHPTHPHAQLRAAEPGEDLFLGSHSPHPNQGRGHSP